jgi:hypothetical protein
MSPHNAAKAYRHPRMQAERRAHEHKSGDLIGMQPSKDRRQSAAKRMTQQKRFARPNLLRDQGNRPRNRVIRVFR